MKELLKYYETNAEECDDYYYSNINLDKVLEELKHYDTWERKIYIRETKILQANDGVIYKSWTYLGYYQNGKYCEEVN